MHGILKENTNLSAFYVCYCKKERKKEGNLLVIPFEMPSFFQKVLALSDVEAYIL